MSAEDDSGDEPGQDGAEDGDGGGDDGGGGTGQGGAQEGDDDDGGTQGGDDGDGGTGQGGAMPPGSVYSLSGPDAFLFVIDPASGAITPQGWFTPSLDDAWDRDEDHIHDLTRIATPPQGAALAERILLRTVQDGVLEPVDAQDPGAPDDATPDETVAGPPPDDDADDSDTPPPGATGDALHRLEGPDAHLFSVDARGVIAPQGWFTPSLDDAWDRDEDHIHDLTHIITPRDGSPARAETLRLQTQADGSLLRLEDPADFYRMLAAPASGAEALFRLTEEETDEEFADGMDEPA